MQRREFNLVMTAAGVAAAGATLPKKAFALTAADAATLQTTRTPFGAERAGNADGTIPAWTGENLPLPEGPGPYGLMPDFFASDAKVVSIDATNMEQYKDRLTPGLMAMMTRYSGYRIDVYPTHSWSACLQIAPPKSERMPDHWWEWGKPGWLSPVT